VIAAVPLIQELAKRTHKTKIFLSTSTLAGRETADKRLAGMVAGVFFAPVDYAWIIRRVLRRLKPTVVVILETEIWPSFFREANRVGCGLLIVNGRISDRAFPSYRRWIRLFGPVLGLCDRILTQSEEMRARFIAAGAPAGLVSVGGNLKYDFAAPKGKTKGEIGFVLSADRPIWIAASTSADDQIEEEDFVIAAQKQLPGWRLILAPRKPERFEAVAGKLAASGLRWTRRSALADPDADVLLLDSIGELSGVFAVGQVVFMGGTLADRGGHNILEPAIFGKPVIAGPHLENFRDIEEHFERTHALLRITSGAELAGAVLAAAGDPGLGERGRAAAEQKRGATRIAADAVMELYASRWPGQRRPQPAHAFLWVLAQIWKAGSAWDRRRKIARVRRLPVPVVSVGNITAGGTGKTPMIVELLKDFRAFRPGLLTRGHGRMTRDVVTLLPGSETGIARTGDEAQICSKATSAPIGIGGNRFEAGTELIKTANPGLLFLDDGFQHLQLHRDFDLVLIDALSPFGGKYLLPLGRLREPLEGLARADAFVITRSDGVPSTKAIEGVLRKYNRVARIFHAHTAFREWVGCDGSRVAPQELGEIKAIGFCGLGNPESFWKSLERLGIEPLERFTYDDHHRYTPAELRRLARRAKDIGATMLLTTEKDMVNLDADFRAIIAPLRLYWLEIGLEIQNREELIRLISARLPPVNL
jgi:3-deoxy-D-manno-octulosonic-acid transferase